MSWAVIFGIIIAIASNVDWVSLISAIIKAISQNDQLIEAGVITKDEARVKLIDELTLSTHQDVLDNHRDHPLSESDARLLIEMGLKLHRYFGKDAVEKVDSMIAKITAIRKPLPKHDEWWKDEDFMRVYKEMREKLEKNG